MSLNDLVLNLQALYTQLDTIEVRGRMNHATILAMQNLIEKMAKELTQGEGEPNADVHTE